MAGDRVFFAAQQRDTEPVRAVEESLDARAVPISRGNEVVPDMAVWVVDRHIFWSAPEFLAEEDVPHSLLQKRSLQLISVELAVVPRKGVAPYVSHDLDAVHPEKADQDVDRVS